MNPLKIGISGVRGIVGETFTPHLAVRFTEAFASYAPGPDIFICNDARPSAHMVRSAVIAGLLGAGCSPVDFGVCPVPSLQFNVSRLGAHGAIAISAGHNPQDWNALKFIREDGLHLNVHQGDELLDSYHHGEFTRAAWNEIKPLRRKTDAHRVHIKAILESVDVKRIKAAGFKVAFDASNGSCAAPAIELFDALGCTLASINDEPGETMSHDPEPNPANMRQLRSLVRAVGCDIGFMTDTAGERIGLVTDSAETLTEERSLAVCTEIMLSRKHGVVVTNLSTTKAIDDIARKHSSKVIRTPIGQAYVAETAMKHRAVVAGEGSGGVILPHIHFASDALASMALILDHVARSGPVSKLNNSLPSYSICKKNIPLDYTFIPKVIQKVRQTVQHDFKKGSLDLSDGIRLDLGSAWLHVRPSNTEAMIRLIAEAKTEHRARELISLGEELIER